MRTLILHILLLTGVLVAIALHRLHSESETQTRTQTVSVSVTESESETPAWLLGASDDSDQTTYLVKALFNDSSDALDLIRFPDSSNELEEQLRQHERTFVMLGVGWSGFDVRTGPHFLQAARDTKQYKVQFIFYNCDPPREDKLCHRHGWAGQPKFVLFRDHGRRFQLFPHSVSVTFNHLKTFALSVTYHRIHHIDHIQQLCESYSSIVVGVFPSLHSEEAVAFIAAADRISPFMSFNASTIAFAVSTSRSLLGLLGAQSNLKSGLFLLTREHPQDSEETIWSESLHDSNLDGIMHSFERQLHDSKSNESDHGTNKSRAYFSATAL